MNEPPDFSSGMASRARWLAAAWWLRGSRSHNGGYATGLQPGTVPCVQTRRPYWNRLPSAFAITTFSRVPRAPRRGLKRFTLRTGTPARRKRT